MERYRSAPPKTLGGSNVKTIKDYQSSISKNMLTLEEEKIDLPSSNVLQFYTEDGSIISARPSGTEPKIKFYCSVNAPLNNKEDYEKTEKMLDAKLTEILKDLGAA